jgi:hypothetical protein
MRQKVKGLEALLSWLPNAFSATLEPNQVLSDLVLHWMLSAINDEYPDQVAISDIKMKIANLDESITTADKGVGSGDVYEKGMVYAPFGIILQLLPPPLILLDTIKNFLAIRDRRIPGDKAIVYSYTTPFRKGSRSIESLAQVTPVRYPSKTYAAFEAWRAYLVNTNGVSDQSNGH